MEIGVSIGALDPCIAGSAGSTCTWWYPQLYQLDLSSDHGCHQVRDISVNRFTLIAVIVIPDTIVVRHL